jgi:hypothetical protein
MATSANSKKRDDIAKTNSLPPGFIAEHEGEHGEGCVPSSGYGAGSAARGRESVGGNRSLTHGELIERGSVQSPTGTIRQTIGCRSARDFQSGHSEAHAFGRPFLLPSEALTGASRKQPD